MTEPSTDDRPSIAELQRIERDEMALAPWRYDHQGWIETMDRTVNHTGAETEVLTLGARNDHGDGEGTVALRNAAPVLLEIAAAALAWRDRPITDDAVAPLERLLAAIDRVRP